MHRLHGRLLAVAAIAALALALFQPAATAAPIVPADTATPAPVTDLGGGYNSTTFAFDMSWTVPDGDGGSRICGVEGTTPVTDVQCTGADMAFNVDGSGPQSLAVYKNLDNGENNGWRPPFTVTVWALDGPWPVHQGDPAPQVSDPVTQTRLAADFTRPRFAYKTVPYGKSFTLSDVLTDHATGQPLSDQPVYAEDCVDCVHEGDRAQVVAEMTTDASGSVGHTFKSITTETAVGLFFLGGTAYYFADCHVDLTPTAWGTVATTDPQKKAGKTIGVYGTYHYSDTTGTAQLQVKKDGAWQKSGAAVDIKRQKLPKGGTAVGYVAHATEKHKGTYHFRVVMTSKHGSFTSTTVTLKFT